MKDVKNVVKYHADGVTMKDYYFVTNDDQEIMVGEMESYYKDGNIAEKCWFNDDGLLEGESLYWYENGQLQSRCYYNEDGELHGLSEEFFKDGTPWRVVNYKDSELHGECIVYHSNGKVWRKSFFENDILQGPVLEFDEDGNQVRGPEADDVIAKEEMLNQLPAEYVECWEQMVAEAKKQCEGNCPLIEDATIVAMDELLKKLIMGND